MTSKRVLVVDDEHLIRWSLVRALDGAGYQAEAAETGAEARAKYKDFRPHAVLLDICLPDANGTDLLKEFKADDKDLVVIMITAHSDADSAVSALKIGAADYVGKPFDLEDVLHSLEQALEKQRLQDENAYFRRVLKGKIESDNLVGNCPAMIKIYKLIKVAADVDAKTVLITGASGTGKELVARGVHMHSSRSKEPFIDVNCAAIPETLLENELFGHERGAYTDASQKQKGIFEMAQGGTVFLDEIGDMPIGMQAKVLKVIENRRYRRLGGSSDILSDARIVAATNQDLPLMVKEGKFRADLYYRLNVMPIVLPSLRERNSEYGRNIEGVDAQTMHYLMAYDWPGNVRELRNAIERAMMLERSSSLSSQHFSSEIIDAGKLEAGADGSEDGVDDCFAMGQIRLPKDGISLDEVEKQLIQMALKRWDGNQTKAAECLRMSRDTLRYRMKKFDINK